MSQSEKLDPAPNGAGLGTSQAATAEQRNGEAAQSRLSSSNASSASSATSHHGPDGGFDKTPVPHHLPGYTVKITFHRATHLPIADLSNLSCDPYISATLTTSLPTRHKEDPLLRFRSTTLFGTTNPQWNNEWLVAHVPIDGFRLKVRIYDEDSSDRDDRLGNVHVTVPSIDESFTPIREQEYKIKKRSGSKRAYLLRALAVCTGREKEMSGRVVISVEVLGRSDGDEGGRAYTLGRMYWCKHYSPILGRIVGSREPAASAPPPPSPAPLASSMEEPQEKHDTLARLPVTDKKKQHNSAAKHGPGRYNFQANQMQLQGPIPAELYHRYVDFRPVITSLFTSKGLRGLLLKKALHHQHTQVYNFNRQTEYGEFEAPGHESTLRFLDLVHYDEGGRIFTYVLTLDSLIRFTETGKEFGIDLLSKHTMHSDASIYIAFSGEFFIRRLKRPHHPQSPSSEKAEHGKDKLLNHHDNKGNPSSAMNGEPGESLSPPKDAAYYELIIDNDSGTYRPNADMLPLLRGFLSKNFPGLRIVTLDSQKDADRMQRLKKEQRLRKKNEGRHIVYTQSSPRSSISSSDDERLDAQERLFDEEASRQPEKPRHQLGLAIEPLVGDHPRVRHALEGSA